MRIAVTAQGTDREAAFDPRFGRARWFLIHDTETGELFAVDNEQNLQSAQGAGIQAGRRVIELGVQAVITGHAGPKALATLQAGDVCVYLANAATVAEAVEQFQAGLLARQQP